MTDHPDEPVLVANAPSEPVAAIWVSHLEAEGIEADTAGSLTSGFRAEAPGGVQIYVHATDAARAREVLQQVPSDPDEAQSENEDESC